jgi:predicted RecB family nuclease
MRHILAERIFKSSFDCTYKCHLLLNGRHENKTDYEEHMDRFDGVYHREAIARLQEMHSNAKTLHLNSLTPQVLGNSAQLAVIKRVEADGLRSESIVLSRANNGHASFEPVLFHRYEELNARAKLLLAFRAVLIEKVTGIVLTRGRIILGRQFTSATIPLSALTVKAERIIRQVKELAIQQDPPFFLCSHCEICEFQASCRARAIKEDNISQLHGIGRAHIEEQKKKGIFTLHQYSHTFRPRRLPKRVKNESKQRYFALQAQALRDEKIYIHGSPTLPLAETSIYFDIEGIPGRRFQYLFGMLIVTEAAESFQSFWVNDKSEQSTVLIKFCESLSSYSNATLFHYGNYERKALKDIREYIGHENYHLVDRILSSSINVLSILHRHCYFPTYSNRLKDVAGFLGFKFDNSVQSGIRSIMFRERWEETADHVLKDELIGYNRQDCQALKTVCEFVRKSTTLASARENIPGRDEKVHFAESLRKVGEGNRPIFRKAEFACPEFEIVNKCAYFDYQRDRVFARTQRLRRRSGPSRAKRTQRRPSLSTDISAPTPDRCSTCGSRKIILERTIVRWQIDLKYYKTGIGVKKWQPRYLISRHRCLKCNEIMYSPDVSVRGRARYGHGLMCWCVYHNIVAKQSMLSVFRGLKDIFDLDIGTNDVYRFRSTLSSYYNDLSKEILAAILNAGVVHIDETPVKLRKTVGYVWVISSATEVCYLFRESREGAFLQELLGEFRGILVSDFFTAYDSICCRQQKCLVHLMRDINDDLRRNPYDQEMLSVAEPFAKLLKEIVVTIDRYGLCRRHLHKHIKSSEKLCAEIAGRRFTSNAASKYQSRFEKYGGRLFTFLSYDGVPWNNNNAEHAVHYFAKLRRIADGTFTRSSLEKLLVLLTVLQTCEYRRVNALKFLLSGKRQFCEMKGSTVDVS